MLQRPSEGIYQRHLISGPLLGRPTKGLADSLSAMSNLILVSVSVTLTFLATLGLRLTFVQRFAQDLAYIHGPKTSIDYIVVNAGILKYPNVSVDRPTVQSGLMSPESNRDVSHLASAFQFGN